jgi:hypothetical protein
MLRRLGETPTIEGVLPSSLTVRIQHTRSSLMGSAIRHVPHYTQLYTMMGGVTSPAITISSMQVQCAIVTETMAEVSEE